jgi:hypothetical protein
MEFIVIMRTTIKIAASAAAPRQQEIAMIGQSSPNDNFIF